jgi:hypothetical protein
MQAVYETVQTHSHTSPFGESPKPPVSSGGHLSGGSSPRRILKRDGALLVLDAAFQVAAAYAISCIPSPACYDCKSLLNPRFFCVS